MKVAIDISPLRSASKYRGIGKYTEKLIEALKKLPVEDFRLLLLEGESVPADCDLVHYPFFDLFSLTLPLVKPKPTVVTVHDVIPLLFPRRYPSGWRGRFKLAVQKFSLKGATAIITDSHNSKRDIAGYLAYPQERIFVVYLGPSEDFVSAPSRAAIMGVKNKYRLPDKFALYVGDVNYNKNIPCLVRACQKIGLPLVIVGRQAAEKNFDRSHPENQDLVWLQEKIKEQEKPSIFALGYIPEKELLAVYLLAVVYCQVSLSEGFGFPPLTAMNCGCPVIASRRGSLPEVCGAAAFYVDPEDEESLARGIKRLITDDKTRRNLIAEGFRQVKKFTWQKTARQTYEIYKKLVEK